MMMIFILTQAMLIVNLTHLLINYQKISSNAKTKKGKLKSQEEENDVKKEGQS